MLRKRKFTWKRSAWGEWIEDGMKSFSEEAGDRRDQTFPLTLNIRKLVQIKVPIIVLVEKIIYVCMFSLFRGDGGSEAASGPDCVPLSPRVPSAVFCDYSTSVFDSHRRLVSQWLSRNDKQEKA